MSMLAQTVREAFDRVLGGAPSDRRAQKHAKRRPGSGRPAHPERALVVQMLRERPDMTLVQIAAATGKSAGYVGSVAFRERHAR